MMVLFEVVIPIFAIILCGFLAGRFSLLPINGTAVLNLFVYYFALPALLFYSLSTAPIEQLVNWNFILANLATIFTCFLMTIFIFLFFFKKRFPEVSMYGMVTTYGNTGFLGIPLLVAAFGQEAIVPAAIVTLIYDLTVITLVVVTFEITRNLDEKIDNRRSLLPLFGKVGKSVILNPINLSLLLGIAVAIFNLSIPQPIYVFVEVLGPAAGPTALFALGLGLSSQKDLFKERNNQLAEFITLTSLKLIALPLITWIYIHFIFPIEDELWVIAVVVLAALPTGAIVNVFAEKYDTLAKQVPIYIVTTTIISIISISLFLVLLVD